MGFAKRIRRATITVDGQAVSGQRDVEITDNSEWNNDKADADMTGKFVQMSEGPYDIRLELLAEDSNLATGYVESMVITAKEIEVSSAAESSVDQTYTLGDGYLVKDVSAPTDNPGRIAVRGQFETLT